MNVYSCQYLSMKSFKATFLRCFLNKSRHSVKKFKNEKKKKKITDVKNANLFFLIHERSCTLKNDHPWYTNYFTRFAG